MIFVACSGFPVPVSRYFNDLSAVEIVESELGIPGEGSIRRWLREGPKDTGFSLLAPKAMTANGFVWNDENTRLAQELSGVAETLNAKAVVFVAPPEFKGNKANRTIVSEFIAGLPFARGPRIVFDLQGWTSKEIDQVFDGNKVVAAYDPLKDIPESATGFRYLRLGGPAGHRSRYDEASLERVVAHLRELEDDAYCVFTNMDMHVNARHVVAALRGPQAA